MDVSFYPTIKFFTLDANKDEDGVLYEGEKEAGKLLEFAEEMTGLDL